MTEEKEINTLEPCPLDHPVVNGVRFTDFSNEYKQHIWCYDCGLEFEGRVNEPAESVAQRWNTRRAADAGPRGDVRKVAEVIATRIYFEIDGVPDVPDMVPIIVEELTSLPAASTDVLRNEPSILSLEVVKGIEANTELQSVRDLCRTIRVLYAATSSPTLGCVITSLRLAMKVQLHARSLCGQKLQGINQPLKLTPPTSLPVAANANSLLLREHE